MDTHINYDLRADAYSRPLDKFDVSDPQLYFTDTWYPYFERLRREDSGALHAGEPIRAVLGRHQIQRHHEGGGEPPRLLVIRRCRRHQDRRPAKRNGAAELYSHGSAGARRAAQGGRSDREPDEPREDGEPHSRADMRVCSTSCRATRNSTGWTGSRSSSPHGCWPRYSTIRWTVGAS